MLDSFLTFINQHCPSLTSQRCLLCVSGGIDSVVLAKLFYKMSIECVVAHCNFQLRGSESEEDEVFTKALAASYGFSFVSKKFDIDACKAENGISTQMAARKLRYEWFESVRVGLGLDWVVTAHHLDDSFETALLNLTRGTGVPGLRGIAPVNGHLLRPLLYMSRDEIVKYAAKERLIWREDSSNESDDYDRNLIRHQIVPVLKKINPALTTTFKATSTRLAAADRLLREMLHAWEDGLVFEKNGFIHIEIEKLRVASDRVYRLAFISSRYGFNEHQSAEIMACTNGAPGKLFHSPSHELLVDRTYLLIKKRDNQPVQKKIIWEKGEERVTSGALTLMIKKESEHPQPPFSSDKWTAYVPWDKLIFPLTIRNWATGDIFQPYGMGGKNKKVSDLLIDLKINRFEKDRVQVLINGNGEIIWLVGIRTDERYRVIHLNEPQGVILATTDFTNF